MDLNNSLLEDIVAEYDNIRPQIYFKSSMIALSRALQDLVITDEQQHLVIANFQHEKYFRRQQQRFQQMASKSQQIYVLGVPEAQSSFAIDSLGYETIPLVPTDTLAGERYLIIIGQQYSACLIVQEKLSFNNVTEKTSIANQEEVFEGFWTFDRGITYAAADWLLGRINHYRPELTQKTQKARKLFRLHRNRHNKALTSVPSVDLDIFTQRLVTYLQAGQYKLVKAYKEIAAAQKKESSIGKIAAAQRASLDPEATLSVTVGEIGQLFPDCRCILYRLEPEAEAVPIEYEFVPKSMGPRCLVKNGLWSIVLYLLLHRLKSLL